MSQTVLEHTLSVGGGFIYDSVDAPGGFSTAVFLGNLADGQELAAWENGLLDLSPVNLVWFQSSRA